MGVLVFDYYVNTGIKGEEAYAEPGMGDKAFYGINTKIAANTEMLRYYNFITDAYKTKIGYMGADLGSDDYSKAQGALGWQRGTIAVPKTRLRQYTLLTLKTVAMIRTSRAKTCLRLLT